MMMGGKEGGKKGFSDWERGKINHKQ